MIKDIHAIQGQILRGLLLRTSARFSDLKPEEVPSDQFTFHLKQLVESGVIEKNEDGSYQLTVPGKEYANRFDIDSGHIKTEKQGKMCVLVIAFREANGTKEYVMQERLKHPFFGFRGFITGKVKMGESIAETAARELEEETGLKGAMHHKSVCHERIYSSQTGELLEDKCFFVFTADHLEGELVWEFEGGRNEWIPEQDILKGNIFYEVGDLMALTKDGAPAFVEKSYTVEKY